MVYYPYDFRHRLHMHHWHRGPSRLLRFFFGAGAAMFFMKHKECHSYEVKHCIQHRIPPEAYPPPTSQAQVQTQPQAQVPAQAPQGPFPSAAAGPPPQTPPQTPSPEDWHVHRHWHKRWEWGWPPKEGAPQGPSYPAVLPAKPDFWEDEEQRLRRMTQQATETVRVVSRRRVVARASR